jgi:Ca-activated chloride channel homolog
MSLLNWLGALWLALVPALIIVYMLRPRRTRTPVPSLRLWRALPRVERSTSRLRKPPLSLLLILQAILLAAGGLALAQPAFTAPAGGSRVIAIDASGSMLTLLGSAGGRTRFEAAKDEARRAADDMSSEDRATLLRVGANVTTACAGCLRADFLAAVDNMKPGAGLADMDSMLDVAAGLARRAGDGSALPLTVISDGQFGTLATEGLPPMSLNFVRVGSDGNSANVAVAALSARRPPDGRAGWIAYARIENASQSGLNITVQALADTVPLPERTQALPPGGSVGLTWQVPARTVRFTVSIRPGDGMAADDSAVIFLPVDGLHKVAIISAQPDLYRRALSVIDGVEPVSATLNTPGGFAFTVVEGAPSAPLPAGGLVLVNSALDDTGSSPAGVAYSIRLAGKASDVRPVILEAAHPLLAGIDLSALLVADANTVEAPEWLEALVDSPSGPLLLAGEQDGRRVVVLTFDPRQSNLPKLAAFPLLIANITDWLYPLASTQAVVPGDPLRLAPGSVVRTPGGSAVDTGPSGVFLDTDEPGIYRVAGAGGQSELQFAVNAADDPNGSPQAEWPHPELNSPRDGTGGETKNIEFWLPLASMALALLVGEWLVYCWKRGSV